MIQIPNLAKPFLLSGCGALAAWAVLTLPDNARASAQAPPVAYPSRSFSRVELTNARDRMLAINDKFVEIGAVLQDPRIILGASENRASILNMGDKELSALAACEPQLTRMLAASETMRGIIFRARPGAGTHASTTIPEGCLGPPMPGDEFPCADPCFTPLDIACGFVFALEEAFILVNWLSTEVCDVFANVVVLIGEGGNCSACCSAVHVVSALAQLAWFPFKNNLDETAAAEAHATYLRQLPMYNGIVSVNSAVTGPSGLAGKIDTLAAKVDALQATQCETLRLLCLPQAWRHSEISTCAGQPGFPYHQ